MNRDPQPNHELIDAELQVLFAEDAQHARQLTPGELEAKVLALTDPQLVALLDEALLPEQTPDQLTGKILAATMPGHTASIAQTPSDQTPAVLARIGLGPGQLAAAAAIVLVAGIGLWWSHQQPGPDPRAAQSPVVTTDDANQTFAELIEATAQSDAIFDDATDEVQAEIQIVADRIDAYAIDRKAIWSDLDGYEEFLSDLDDLEPGTPAT